jgi:hypothetical protein
VIAGLVALVSLLLVTSTASAPPAAAQVDLTVGHGMTRGSERAPVTIVEFTDFE